MPRVNWEAHEVLRIVANYEFYHRAIQNIKDAKRFGISYDGWQKVAEEALSDMQKLGLPKGTVLLSSANVLPRGDLSRMRDL